MGCCCSDDSANDSCTKTTSLLSDQKEVEIATNRTMASSTTVHSTESPFVTRIDDNNPDGNANDANTTPHIPTNTDDLDLEPEQELEPQHEHEHEHDPEQEQEETEVDRTLELECLSVEPGYIRLKIDCEAGSVGVNQFHYRIKLDYAFEKLDETGSEKNAMTHQCSIQWWDTLTDGSVYLKVNRSFHNYRLRMKAVMFDEFCGANVSELSNELSIDMPSDASEPVWNVGRHCVYGDADTGMATDCQIVESLPNKCYKVCPLRQNNDKRTVIVSLDQLRVSEKGLRNVIDISDWLAIDQCLLSGVFDECIYRALVTTIASTIEVSTMAFRDRLQWSDGYDYIVLAASRIIGSGVMSYLFENTSQWKLGCPFCDEKGVAFSYLKAHCRQSEYGVMLCDICMCQLDSTLGYHCSLSDRRYVHDFCADCVYAIILKHQYWFNTLTPILDQSTQLNYDCIREIVTYVAGFVVKINHPLLNVNI